MNLKKNVFSYLMWSAYSVMVCVGLMGVFGTISTQAGYPRLLGVGISCLGLLLCGLLVWLLHRLTGTVGGRIPSDVKTGLMIECIIAILFFAVGVGLRISDMDSGIRYGAVYYEAAKVAEGLNIPYSIHSADYLYTQLLHLVFVVFGNKAAAGIVMQIALQTAAFLFLYLSVRKMAGALSSLIFLGIVTLSPVAVRESLTLSPRMLFLLIFAVLLYLSAFCIKGRKQPAGCFVTGLFIGMSCYMDVAGLVLPAFLMCGLLMRKEGQDRTIGGRLGVAALCLAGVLLGFFGTFVTVILSRSLSLTDSLSAKFKLYSPGGFQIPVLLDSDASIVSVLILVFLLAVGIFSFWCSPKTERQSIWVLSFLSLIALQSSGMMTEELNGNFGLFVLFAILAGVGVAGIFAKNDAYQLPETAGCTAEEENVWKDVIQSERREKKITDSETMENAATGNETAENEMTEIELPACEETENIPVEDEIGHMEKDVTENQAAENPSVAHGTADTVTPENEKSQEYSAAARKPVKLIESPLPLPKKHVPKVLDYAVTELETKQDDFDVAVDDNDDFDI